MINDNMKAMLEVRMRAKLEEYCREANENEDPDVRLDIDGRVKDFSLYLYTEQSFDVYMPTVRAFLGRLCNGTALDDCGNTDDDSVFELALRAGSPYMQDKLKHIGQTAERLLKLISSQPNV